MRISVNGEAHDVSEPCTLGQLVTPRPGLAAAVNGTVITGSAWDVTTLHEGDAVEVLTAIQGG